MICQTPIVVLTFHSPGYRCRQRLAEERGGGGEAGMSAIFVPITRTVAAMQPLNARHSVMVHSLSLC